MKLRALLFAAAFVGCGLPLAAHAAAPAPPSEQAKAIRTLTYTFEQTNQGTYTARSSGIGTTASQISTGIASDAWQGTVTVDVLGVATNGALNLRMTQTIENDPHRYPIVLCSTLPTMYVECVKQDDPELTASTAERTIAEYLAPNFIDGSKIVDNRWQVSLGDASLRETVDLNVLANDNNILTLTANRKFVYPANLTATGQDTVTYDMRRTAPITINDEVVQQAASRKLTIKLVKDSLVDH